MDAATDAELGGTCASSTDAPGAGLLIDLYELTMAAVHVGEGTAEMPATFSLFVRELPPTRGCLVAAGLDDALAHLQQLRFTGDDIACLTGLGLFGRPVLERLARLSFTGSVRAVPEGSVVFAGEPLLEISAPLIEAQLAETFLLNQITTATTLASKAARYRYAAGDRPVVDFGFRRAQGVDAAMKLARAVAICGLAGTSNVAGACRYGVPLSGTMAHSFIQAHPDETTAFRAFARTYGDRSVLLVDTYDTVEGIEHAITVAGELRRIGVELPGIRLDSGDLVALARHARRRLDETGFPDVQVLASGGLDEHLIQRLAEQEVPIDGYGVGSDLAVSADAPVLDAVYKLVAVDGRPVRKLSRGKATLPGPKQVWRRPDWSGDVLALAEEPAPAAGAVPLLVTVMRDGSRADPGRASLYDAHARFEEHWACLPERHKHLRAAQPWTVELSDRLRELTESLEMGSS